MFSTSHSHSHSLSHSLSLSLSFTLTLTLTLALTLTPSPYTFWKELIKTLSTLGNPVGEDRVAQIFKQADTDGDGTLSLVEFLSALGA